MNSFPSTRCPAPLLSSLSSPSRSVNNITSSSGMTMTPDTSGLLVPVEEGTQIDEMGIIEQDAQLVVKGTILKRVTRCNTVDEAHDFIIRLFKVWRKRVLANCGSITGNGAFIYAKNPLQLAARVLHLFENYEFYMGIKPSRRNSSTPATSTPTHLNHRSNRNRTPSGDKPYDNEELKLLRNNRSDGMRALIMYFPNFLQKLQLLRQIDCNDLDCECRSDHSGGLKPGKPKQGKKKKVEKQVEETVSDANTNATERPENIKVVSNGVNTGSDSATATATGAGSGRNFGAFSRTGLSVGAAMVDKKEESIENDNVEKGDGGIVVKSENLIDDEADKKKQEDEKHKEEKKMVSPLLTSKPKSTKKRKTSELDDDSHTSQAAQYLLIKEKQEAELLKLKLKIEADKLRLQELRQEYHYLLAKMEIEETEAENNRRQTVLMTLATLLFQLGNMKLEPVIENQSHQTHRASRAIKKRRVRKTDTLAKSEVKTEDDDNDKKDTKSKNEDRTFKNAGRVHVKKEEQQVSEE